MKDAGPGKGRGVFALAAIPSGTLLEVAPVLIIPSTEWLAHGQHTMLAHYTFEWPGGCQAICLGTFGSMWNHAKRPNVGYMRSMGSCSILFRAIRDISAGEECCISYGARLWFEDASADAADDGFSDDDATTEDVLTAIGLAACDE